MHCHVSNARAEQREEELELPHNATNKHLRHSSISALTPINYGHAELEAAGNKRHRCNGVSSPELGGCIVVHAPADNADHVVDVEVIIVPRVDALMVPAHNQSTRSIYVLIETQNLLDQLRKSE